MTVRLETRPRRWTRRARPPTVKVSKWLFNAYASGSRAWWRLCIEGHGRRESQVCLDA